MSFYGRVVLYIPDHDPDGTAEPIEALCVQEHGNLESHNGQGGEPMLHLITVDLAKEHINLADFSLKLLKHFDVAHASHEFTEEEAKKYGDVFAGGRWHESRNPRAVLKEIAARKKAEADAKAAEAKEAAEKAEQQARDAKDAEKAQAEADKHAHADLVADKVAAKLAGAKTSIDTPPAKPDPEGSVQ